MCARTRVGVCVCVRACARVCVCISILILHYGQITRHFQQTIVIVPYPKCVLYFLCYVLNYYSHE
jgi:hypothetical protein